MKDLLLILGMVAATFPVRYTLFALAGRFQFPPAVADALRYVPPAVLTAIIVPAVLMPSGETWLTLDNPYLLGALIAVAVAWFSRHLLLTIVVGMCVFLLLKHLIL
ncbi:AzlD domain-containing protein [Aestuariirhabdus litorea]|uniref:AzlD domain-containing protein n=1 Tax=Aestuariirhabdus litorea TaxID=2528527 RepID=A0A3P3VP90_9GAMM|nr:AzlD domain-containing protein [Aestuariirhabdus litorea]RRJ84430.1 AzlD domain-containing protein [Aestuariirhabdus litorea]RWW97654.1 AzlD domain-containing protein [Endozoicomonadaceae bacterium GTF-13]